MSAFLKPSTPTKSRQSITPETPTKSKTMLNTSDVSNSSSEDHNYSSLLEDINLLLYLETIKRYRDNELHLKQSVEAATKLFEERRDKYFKLVAKYAALVKLASTRKVLLRNELIQFPTETASTDAKIIKDKLSSGIDTDYISAPELEKFKEMLNLVGTYKNLPDRRSELVNLQNATDAIQHLIESIEISLEQCTTQGLDHFANILEMNNFPKLLSEYEENEY